MAMSVADPSVDDTATMTVVDTPGPPPGDDDTTAPTPVEAAAALLLHRRRVRVRTWAARIVTVLAILGLLATVAPRLPERFHVFREIIPGLGILGSTSGFAARIIAFVALSMLLFLVARGLRVGWRTAWMLAVVGLVLQAIMHLVHGVSVITSTLMLVGGIWLACEWRAFPVVPTKRSLRRAIGLGLLLIVSNFIVALAVEAIRRFGSPDFRAGDATQRLVDVIGIGVEVVFVLLQIAIIALLAWRLSSPKAAEALSPAAHHTERERARAVVDRYGGGTLDYFALRDDKDWFFVGRSVVAYSVRGGVCLVSPDPIGPVSEREMVWAEFSGFVAEHGWSVAVVAAAEDYRPIYRASGLHCVYLGDEAIVDAPAFSLDGHDRKSLRQAYRRVERAGYTATFVDPVEIARDDPELKAAIEAMSAESRRGEDERGFSMTLSRLFDPEDTGLMLSVTRAPDGRVDAFCQWVPARDLNGWSLDVMRRRTDVDDLPNGLIDFTIVATILELARRGEGGLGLNFAVLHETLEGERDLPLEPITRTMLGKVDEVTQMSSLAVFNEKYGARWVHRWVVLDQAETAPMQALIMASAEGATEIPLLGRLIGAVGRS
ncbi:MAG: phosphatidylglycerol lysyltransferase domain-containing protein [Propionibacteriaceae bacterium]|jgi:lysyl-tRNA synthetase class 2|nr:phosphatidylglycerol lysyltransferase domain-containing protein [Propionibacteriaceae bacterium]